MNPRNETSSTSTRGSIKMIFFDAVGTLIHLPKGVGFHYAEVGARHGAVFREQDLNAAFRAAWKRIPPRSPGDGPRPDDDKGWWRELVGYVIDDVGPGGIDRESYFEDLYAEFARPGVWALFPEVPEVLAALRRTHRLGILSNFDGRLRIILKQLGMESSFDPVILSSEVGADKPDPRIFEAALTAARVRADEAILVGDDPELDEAGALAVGMHTVLVQRPKTDLTAVLHRLGLP
jgi:putative hydrolase of the HAD superfamily